MSSKSRISNYLLTKFSVYNFYNLSVKLNSMSPVTRYLALEEMEFQLPIEFQTERRSKKEGPV